MPLLDIYLGDLRRAILTNKEYACASCGANIAAGEEKCPHCGKAGVKVETIKQDSSTSATRESGDGIPHVEFVDGKKGPRAYQGVDGVKVSGGSQVREGITDEIKCPRCMTVQKKSNKNCEKCGSSLAKRRVSIRFGRSS